MCHIHYSVGKYTLQFLKYVHVLFQSVGYRVIPHHHNAGARFQRDKKAGRLLILKNLETVPGTVGRAIAVQDALIVPLDKQMVLLFLRPVPHFAEADLEFADVRLVLLFPCLIVAELQWAGRSQHRERTCEGRRK